MSPWQKHNLTAIDKRLADVRRARQGVLFERQSPYNDIVVRRTREQLLLCYRHPRQRVEEIESRLSLTDPLALLSEYTQAMLLALAWRPTPQRILLIGLGGGRLQLVLHHYLEQVSLYTVELDPLVLDVAQRFFGFATDERQHVIVEDGRAYVSGAPAEAPYDLIFLDAYRVGGVPLHLSTREFYDDCRAVLTSGGAVAANLQAGSSLYHAARKTFASAFRHSAVFPLLAGNVVVVSSDAEQFAQDQIRARAVAVQRQYGFDFSLPGWVETLSTFSSLYPHAPILRDSDLAQKAPLRPKG
jgi:spermidine synthase